MTTEVTLHERGKEQVESWWLQSPRGSTIPGGLGTENQSIQCGRGCPIDNNG